MQIISFISNLAFVSWPLSFTSRNYANTNVQCRQWKQLLSFPYSFSSFYPSSRKLNLAYSKRSLFVIIHRIKEFERNLEIMVLDTLHYFTWVWKKNTFIFIFQERSKNWPRHLLYLWLVRTVFWSEKEIEHILPPFMCDGKIITMSSCQSDFLKWLVQTKHQQCWYKWEALVNLSFGSESMHIPGIARIPSSSCHALALFHWTLPPTSVCSFCPLLVRKILPFLVLLWRNFSFPFFRIVIVNSIWDCQANRWQQ